MAKTNSILKMFNSSWLPTIIQIIGFALLYWLGTHFVTIQKFEAHEKENESFVARNDAAHTDITKALAEISKTLAIMDFQGKRIEDHELRIRVLEGHPKP